MRPAGLEGGLEGGGRTPPTGSFNSPRGYNSEFLKTPYEITAEIINITTLKMNP